MCVCVWQTPKILLHSSARKEKGYTDIFFNDLYSKFNVNNKNASQSTDNRNGTF